MLKHKLLYIFSACILLSIIACNPYRKVSYTTTVNSKEKILKGVINRKVIEADTAFGWFKENMKWGKTDDDAVNTFKTKADKFNIIIFGGTWCEDTQNILPKFYKLVDESGYPDKKILLLGVDRKKNTIDSLNLKYKITNVPTFIVMHHRKEVGRVVEYGTKGDAMKELAEIVNSIP